MIPVSSSEITSVSNKCIITVIHKFFRHELINILIINIAEAYIQSLELGH